MAASRAARAFPAKVTSKLAADLVPLAYFKGVKSGSGSFGTSDVPVKPPANRDAPRGSPGRRRIVVFDKGPQSYLAALLDTIGAEGYFANSGDNFAELLHAHRPHLVFLHVFHVQEVRRVRSDPAISSTPIVMLSSVGEHADRLMAQERLTGPIVSVPFALEEVQRALDTWGRGPDQPFPDQIPYSTDDPSLTVKKSEPCVCGGRKILLRCRDTFYKSFLARTIGGVELLPDHLRAPLDSWRPRFAAEIGARAPRLLIWFTDTDLFLRNIGMSLAPLGIKTLVLTTTKHELIPGWQGDHGDAMMHHVLPMPKAQLMRVIDDLRQ